MTGRHDILIVGGGLVGASLAIALDALGLDVGLVEAAPPGQMPAVFDQRNLSFGVATVNALTALGVMAKLPSPPGSIQRIHVSRVGDFGSTVLSAGEYGREAFGQVVVAREFGAALEARLGELTRLVRYRPAHFLGLTIGTAAELKAGVRGVRVTDADGERVLHARLLVAADGSTSAMRSALGIAASEFDYQQTLFVARMRAERAPDGTAYERFGDHGPTALLPRGDRHFGVVHGVHSDRADEVEGLDDAGWIARIQQAFGWRVGRFLSTGQRSRYPVRKIVAEQITAPRAVLLGNAAQTIHPIGAQGFNLGLRDALTLAELLAGAPDPGEHALLQAYRERRREDREQTLQFTDGLARFTGDTSPLLRPLRSLGLLAAANAPALQSMLVGGAMGFRGHVPALCREAWR